MKETLRIVHKNRMRECLSICIFLIGRSREFRVWKEKMPSERVPGRLMVCLKYLPPAAADAAGWQVL
jgi:hypothetical protein